MDFKILGRTWVGNIYHKFEGLCQEVDGYVSKDSGKTVENQVQTVGERVNKLISNTVNSFLPPMVNSEQTEAQVTMKQNDTIGTHIESVEGIKGKHRHASESQLSEKQGTITSLNCNLHEVESQRQVAYSPFADHSEEAETGLNLEEDGDTSIYENGEMVGEFFIKEGSSENSNSRDQKSIILSKFSPKYFVEDAELDASETEIAVWIGEDLSEVSNTGLYSEQDCDSAIYKNSENMDIEENATNKEYPLSEAAASSLEEKDSYELSSCVKEQDQVPRNSCLLQDGNSFVSSTGLNVVLMEKIACNIADPSEVTGADLSLEQHVDIANFGMPSEENVTADKPRATECKSSPICEISSKLSVCSGEPHLLAEEPRAPEDETSFQSLKMENHMITIQGLFPLATSVRDEGARVLQEEKRVKYHGEEYASSLIDKSLRSRNLHLEAEELDSPEDRNMSESSLILSDDDCKSTILAGFSPAISIHDAGLMVSQKDEIICNRFSDVLGTNPSSDLYCKNKTLEAEATSSSSSVSLESFNTSELSMANYGWKVEQSCYGSADSVGRVPNISSISSESFSDLTFDNMAVNQIPSSSSRVLTAVLDGHGDDPAIDVTDPSLKTIDLSDKVKLEETCLISDNRLLYASCRPRKFKSYKKLIQDAFASRKRLIKEYEQLAISYGDIDTETSLQPGLSFLPPVTAASVCSTASQTCDVGEPEWELL